jgi:hypothetical protein
MFCICTVYGVDAVPLATFTSSVWVPSDSAPEQSL